MLVKNGVVLMQYTDLKINIEYNLLFNNSYLELCFSSESIMICEFCVFIDINTI